MGVPGGGASRPGHLQAPPDFDIFDADLCHLRCEAGPYGHTFTKDGRQKDAQE